jgi:hypothetical protein
MGRPTEKSEFCSGQKQGIFLHSVQANSGDNPTSYSIDTEANCPGLDASHVPHLVSTDKNDEKSK